MSTICSDPDAVEPCPERIPRSSHRKCVPRVCRHFHQLFRQLRVTQNSGSHRDIVEQDLGYFDNLLRIRRERVEEAYDVRQLFHHLRHRCIENLHHGSKAHEVDNVLHGVPLDSLLRPRVRDRPQAAPLRCLRQTTRRTPHPWLLWTSVSVELCSQPPRPCPSSVPVGRRTFHQPPHCRSGGGRLRTGPLRRSAAHVSTMSADVAVFSATWSRPPGSTNWSHRKETQTSQTCFVVVLETIKVRNVYDHK